MKIKLNYEWKGEFKHSILWDWGGVLLISIFLFY